MRQRQVLAALFLLIGLGVLTFVILSRNTPSTAPIDTTPSVFKSPRVAYASSSSIEILHTNKSGQHTYSGHLLLSDCDTLSAGLHATGENPPKVTLRLSIYRPEGACEDYQLEDVFEQEFSASISLPKVTPIFSGVTINDEPSLYRVVEQK